MAISPRSANYERLEGGMGPSRNTIRRFAWKKFAVGAAILIGIVWFVGPREPRSFWASYKNNGHYNPNTDLDNAPAPASPASTTPNPSTSQPSSQPTTPHTFETDPDPTHTPFCTSPHTPGTPLVQYALMIDAGSTGSRIHIYKFNNCLPSPSYEYEFFNQTHPGLSSYAGRPLDAARSLDVLMEDAMRLVPRELRGCTPVAVKATAGLRLLGGTQAEDILAAVEERLRQEWVFPLALGKPVSVMDGKDEGVYAWITANYLLGNLDSKAKHGEKGEGTYAVLDLGGASTQIAFEPTRGEGGTVLEEGDHRFELTYGKDKHVLYQHSYLGYGLMHARKQVHKLVEFMAGIHANGEAVGEEVGNACLARGTRRTVEVEDSRGKRNVTMVGEDVGSFEGCSRVMELVMAKDAICKAKPCSFNGVYQPSILSTFPTGPILLLSYFYDRLSPLLPPLPTSSPPDTPLTLSVGTIATLARSVCAGRPGWLEHWGAEPHVMGELQGRPEWCLDLTYMWALLGRGYEFGEGREVGVAKRVGGTELGWCLGATLAVVAGELECTD
ncbi:nucleoside phosphatase family-domain-containing protein [Lyophyllum atratum]|nr:nucleoside phosphatase family-domain-containing protein [Lyophyllum atratum]